MGCVFGKPDYELSNYRFNVVKEIAQGGFSVVYLVREKDSNLQYAMKKIVMTDEREDMEGVKQEVEMHRLFSNPHIVPLTCFCRPKEDTFCLFFPYYENGTLADFVTKKRERHEFVEQKEVIRWFREICSAVTALHEQSIAHRDIKPLNFLLDVNLHTKLTDFGSSCKMPLEVSSFRESLRRMEEAARLCSMAYRAPELFTCYTGTQLTTAVDIWSLGCLLYFLLFGASPFDLVHAAGGSIALAVQSPETLQYPSDTPYDTQMIHIIRLLLVVDQGQRPTCEDIINSHLKTLTLPAKEPTEIASERYSTPTGGEELDTVAV